MISHQSFAALTVSSTNYRYNNTMYLLLFPASNVPSTFTLKYYALQSV